MSQGSEPDTTGLAGASATGDSKHPSKRRRRIWALVVGLAVVMSVVGTVAYVTLPPTPPFHELWSRSLEGNPYGGGAGEGSLFVTYTAQVTGAVPPLEDVKLTAVAINVSSGQTLWTSRTLLISDVVHYFVEIHISAPFAYLLCTAGSATGANLSVLAVNLAKGNTEGNWQVQLPAWFYDLPPSDQVVLSNSTIVFSYPANLGNPMPFVVTGVDALSGARLWQTTVPLNGSGGWGTGAEDASVYGLTAVFAVAVSPVIYTGGQLLGVDISSGSILFVRNITGSAAIVPGVVDSGAYYFLDKLSQKINIVGVNLSTGLESSAISVQNVADEDLFSAELFTAGPVLLVASYSPSLSYAAYLTNGTAAWSLGFPDSPACPGVNYSAIGPCDTLLNQPLQYGNESAVLLASEASVLVQGSTYHDVYRLVSLGSGADEWNFDYHYTYGTTYPWYGPVPAFEVESVIGNSVIYTIQTPDGMTTAGGTL